LLRTVSAPGRPMPEAGIRGYAAPYYSLGCRHAFISTVQAMLNANTRHLGNATLRSRSRRLWCRRDRIVPFATGRPLPNARLVTLSRCNHLPQDEVPRALRPFLAR
jgi:pimeloyl-ACP methyl ester carboxylesterase